MTQEKERAQLQEAFAALGETAAPGPDCPEPDRLWAAAIGESPLPERHDVIAHTATCASCAAAFRLARGMSQEKVQPESTLLRMERRPWARWAGIVAVAAAVALAVLVPGLWRSEPTPYRGGEGQEIRSLVEEAAVLPRDQAELLWTAGPSGSRYEVRVLTREGTEIAVESGLEAPHYRIPPSALAGVPAGTVLYWQVKALRPDGKSSASKTFEVRLR